MPDPPKAIALDVDPDSLVSLRQAFPEWDIEATHGAAAGALSRDCHGATAALLVVGAADSAAATSELCRGLRRQAAWAHTPLLVLVDPAQEALVRAALEAGADSCLRRPVHVKDLVHMLARAREGNQPGRHTLDLDRAQREDAWRDEGGEA